MDPTNLLNDISAFLSYMHSNGQHMLPIQTMMHMLPMMQAMPPMPHLQCMQPWVSQSLSNLVPEPPMLDSNDNKQDAKELPRKRNRSRSRSRIRDRGPKRDSKREKIIDALYDEFRNMPEILNCYKSHKVINKLMTVPRDIAFSAIRQTGFVCRKHKVIENPVTLIMKQVNSESMRANLISAQDYIDKCFRKGYTDIELRNRILKKIYRLIDDTRSRPIYDIILENVKEAPLSVLFATIDTVSKDRATFDMNEVLIMLMRCAECTRKKYSL